MIQSVPPIFLDHVGHLYYEFALLVLLACFKSMFLYIIMRSEPRTQNHYLTLKYRVAYQINRRASISGALPITIGGIKVLKHSTNIFPSKCGSARAAIYVRYCMKSCQ